MCSWPGLEEAAGNERTEGIAEGVGARVCSERSISFVQEEGQRVVEVGVLWEIASWGMISSSVATEVDHEPFSDPGETLESLDGCSAVGLECKP